MNGTNLFIIDDNPIKAAGLQNSLFKKFGNSIDITTFYNSTSALDKINSDTSIVILDYKLENDNGNEVLKSIKEKNPKTKVVMFSSNEEVAVIIDSFRKGASDYVVTGKSDEKKIVSIVYNMVTYPVRVLVKEFGISKYLSIFIVTFALIGIAVYFAMYLIP